VSAGERGDERGVAYPAPPAGRREVAVADEVHAEDQQPPPRAVRRHRLVAGPEHHARTGHEVDLSAAEREHAPPVQDVPEQVVR
jgi:hypothetical protein